MHFASIGSFLNIDSATVNAEGSAIGNWIDFSRVEIPAFFVLIESATTPSVDVYVDISPYSVSTLTDGSTDLTQYAVLQLNTTTLTTAAEMQRYVSTEPVYPAMAARLRIVGDATNGTDTKVSAWISTSVG